jgi:predicted acetyltransferase
VLAVTSLDTGESGDRVAIDVSRRLRLRPLRPDDEAAVVAAHRAMTLADGFPFALRYETGMPWTAYLERLESWRCGNHLPSDWVPATFLVADVGGQVVGRTSIRHRLNDFLAREGGHIGYGVVAEHRGRGYATEILRQSLVIARAAGVDRVLVVCEDENVPSARVIERCGGVLEERVPWGEGGKLFRRYWID